MFEAELANNLILVATEWSGKQYVDVTLIIC